MIDAIGRWLRCTCVVLVFDASCSAQRRERRKRASPGRERSARNTAALELLPGWAEQSAPPERPPRGSTHAPHEPPQSTPVSSPFWTPSSHAAAAHMSLSHTPLAQSLATPQV